MTTRLDFSIWRGSNSPAIIWQFDTIDLAGSSFVLSLKDRLGRSVLTIDSAVDDDLVVNAASKSVTWLYTVDQSNLLPTGKLTSYTLERHLPDAEESVYAQGLITGYETGGSESGAGDPTVLVVVTGPQGPPGPGVTQYQSIVHALIFG